MVTVNKTNRKKVSDNRELLEFNLRKMIQNDCLDLFKPIPTEATLGKEYNLCRNTVRKVLQILTDEGLLIKKHGLGTFIVPKEKRSPEKITLNKIAIFLLSKTNNPFLHIKYSI